MARKRIIPRRRHLAFESLEGRRVLAAFNMPWPEPDGISISFLPDGTQVGNQESNLFGTLEQLLPQAVWQESIMRAFQTWAVTSNVNFTLAGDSGLPVGVLGFKQGDPRFGDIRIGAISMANDVLAVANPYDAFVANTWVGDVFLNSAAIASLTADSASQLLAVMLHEAGHTVGVSHSDDASSPMFPRLQGSRISNLTSADAAALQAQYGPRRADAWEGVAGNDTPTLAATLPLGEIDGQPYHAVAAADLTSLADVDLYRVVLPQGVTLIDLRLQAAGVSLLTPRMSVLDVDGNVVASTQSLDPRNNDLSLIVDQFRPGDVFFVRVEAARNDVFGIGAYHLEVAPHGSRPAIPPNREPLSSEPQLLATTPGYVEHTYYEVATTLDAFQPAVTYRVRSVDLGPDLNNVFTVVVEGNGNPSPLDVQIFDDRGNAVDFSVLSQDAGMWQIQVENVLSYADYLIQVSADISLGPVEVEVEVDFAQDGAHQETFVNDSLASDEHQLVRTLLVNQSQQFHFALGASDYSLPEETGVRMAIENAAGQTVFEMTVADGAVRTGDTVLSQGVYTVRFTRAGNGDAVLFFQLTGAVQSSPIGPLLHDTTLDPVVAPVDTVLAQLSYYWLPNRYAELAQAQAVNRSLQAAALFNPALGALRLPNGLNAEGGPSAGGIVGVRPAESGSTNASHAKTINNHLDRLTSASNAQVENDVPDRHDNRDLSPRRRPSQYGAGKEESTPPNAHGDKTQFNRAVKAAGNASEAPPPSGEAGDTAPVQASPPSSSIDSSRAPNLDQQPQVTPAPNWPEQSLRQRLAAYSAAVLAAVLPFVTTSVNPSANVPRNQRTVLPANSSHRLRITRLR